MSDELARMELALERVAVAESYPPTPQLDAGVRARIESAGRQAHRPPRAWGLAITMAAAIVVAGTTVVGAVSPAREALADLFDRISIFQAEEVPTGLPANIRGQPVTLEEAEERLGRRILLPLDENGAEIVPSRILYQQLIPSDFNAIALFYEGRKHGTPFILLETDAGLGKGLAPEAKAEPVDNLGDGEAYWLEGTRVVQLYDESGNFIRESQRQTDSNTLVWVQGGLAFRLESDLSKDDAMKIAATIR